MQPRIYELDPLAVYSRPQPRDADGPMERAASAGVVAEVGLAELFYLGVPDCHAAVPVFLDAPVETGEIRNARRKRKRPALLTGEIEIDNPRVITLFGRIFADEQILQMEIRVADSRLVKRENRLRDGDGCGSACGF